MRSTQNIGARCVTNRFERSCSRNARGDLVTRPWRNPIIPTWPPTAFVKGCTLFPVVCIQSQIVQSIVTIFFLTGGVHNACNMARLGQNKCLIAAAHVLNPAVTIRPRSDVIRFTSNRAQGHIDVREFQRVPQQFKFTRGKFIILTQATQILDGHLSRQT